MVISCGLSCQKRASTTDEKKEVPVTAAESGSQTEPRKPLVQLRAEQVGNIDVLGRAELDKLREKLKTRAAHNTVELIQTHTKIGVHERRLGNNEASVQSLESAHGLLSSLKGESGKKLENEVTYELALSYLRLGETQNCVAIHSEDSCLLPIRGKGVHINKKGSTKATEHLLRLLAENPEHLKARWLLNIAFMTLGDYPSEVPGKLLIPEAAFNSEAPFPRFFDVASALGLDTHGLAGGAVVDDFNGDGFLDIAVSSWHPADQLRFFRNNGDGSFSDKTEQAGLLGISGGLNLVHADYDNDGTLDLLVLRGGWLGMDSREQGRLPNSLLRNDGTGRFTDVSEKAGLVKENYPTQTAGWADYDNDGDLDLYVGNEGHPNQLFQNQGDGSFRDVAKQAGVDNPGITKGVSWGDYDGDAYVDIYSSQLEGPNQLYGNKGDGSFVDVADKLGVKGPSSSFATWFWDFNNDGALDLYVPSYPMDMDALILEYLGRSHSAPLDSLFQGDGGGTFRDVAVEQNLGRVTMPMGSNYGDLNNDGFLDFYLGTGYPNYDALMPNLMFLNRGGKGFHDVTTAGGFGHLQKGHGVAFADVDNDGDQDVFIELGGWYPGDTFPNVLYENPGFGNNWITIRLVGVQSNRSAIGAKIHVVIDDNGVERSIFRWVNSGSSFGGNPLRQEIGLGKATTIQRVEVTWPMGKTPVAFTNVAVDQFLEITEGEAAVKKLSRPSFRLQKATP